MLVAVLMFIVAAKQHNFMLLPLKIAVFGCNAMLLVPTARSMLVASSRLLVGDEGHILFLEKNDYQQ